MLTARVPSLQKAVQAAPVRGRGGKARPHEHPSNSDGPVDGVDRDPARSRRREGAHVGRADRVRGCSCLLDPSAGTLHQCHVSIRSELVVSGDHGGLLNVSKAARGGRGHHGLPTESCLPLPRLCVRMRGAPPTTDDAAEHLTVDRGAGRDLQRDTVVQGARRRGHLGGRLGVLVPREQDEVDPRLMRVTV